MADEPITTPTPTPDPQPSRAEERITELSAKVALTSKERDELKTLNESVTRERDFYKGFSDIVSTNPAAKDHQEDILTKVKSGYTVQDATFAVLGAAGKLGNTPAPAPQSPAGGSAPTTLPQGGVKPIGEMTQEERRAELANAIQWN